MWDAASQAVARRCAVMRIASARKHPLPPLARHLGFFAQCPKHGLRYSSSARPSQTPAVPALRGEGGEASSRAFHDAVGFTAYWCLLGADAREWHGARRAPTQRAPRSDTEGAGTPRHRERGARHRERRGPTQRASGPNTESATTRNRDRLAPTQRERLALTQSRGPTPRALGPDRQRESGGARHRERGARRREHRGPTQRAGA